MTHTAHHVLRTGATARFAAYPQVLIGAGSAIVAAMFWFAAPQPYAPLVLPLAGLAIILALRCPFYVCAAFILFSVFRLHEVFSILNPLRLPLLLAGLVAIGMLARSFAGRMPELPWSLEIKAMVSLFALVTFGLLFAVEADISMNIWLESYWKIVAMSLLLACFMRELRHIKFFGLAIVVLGVAVALVAITNHASGIGLVEGTRITIARDMASPLGDPNELALVLLIPFSYAAAFALRGARTIDRLLGWIGTPIILYAILLTQSRGGVVAVGAAILLLTLMLSRRKIWVIAGAVVIAVGLILTVEMLERSDLSAAESADSRLYAWAAALRMVLAYPLTGVGIGGFEAQYYRFTSVWTYAPYTAHNALLQALGEVGLPGAIVFVVMLVAAIRAAFLAWRKASRCGLLPDYCVSTLAVLASFASICVGSVFLSTAFSWPFYILVATTAAIHSAVFAIAPRSTGAYQPSRCLVDLAPGSSIPCRTVTSGG